MIFELNSKTVLSDLDPAIQQAVKKYFTLPNPKYAEAERMNRSTRDIDRNLKIYEERQDGLACPRGCAAKIYRLCERLGESIQVVDNRRTLTKVDFTFAGGLRPLQTQAVDNVFTRDSGLLEAGTGAGKTVMGLYIIAQRGQPALVVVHTKELLNQWLDRVESFLGIPRNEIGIIGGGKFSIGAQITVATVQSLYKKVDDVVPHIGHLVVDECFPAGTMVKTKIGQSEIQNIQVGDEVTGYNQDTGEPVETTVINIFKKEVRDLCRLTFADGSALVCTPEHPIFDGEKYIPADSFQENQIVWRHQNENCNRTMCCMRENDSMSGGQAMEDFPCSGESGARLLFPGVCGNPETSRLQKKRRISCGIQSESRSDEQNHKQSNEGPQSDCQYVGSQAGKWNIESCTKKTRGEWAGTHQISERPCKGFGMDHGVSRQNGCTPAKRKTAGMVEETYTSDLLQAGYCKPRTQNRCRDRRDKSYREKAKTGSKEKCLFEKLRVASVEIIQQASRSGLSGLCPDGHVYNIETGTGNYFAKGILVHNCHRAPSRIFTEAVNSFDARYRLGLTATPWRRDKLSKVIFWTMGDVTGRIDKKDLVDQGNLCPAEVRWVKTEFSPFSDASEFYSQALSELTEDDTRNRLICKTVAENKGRGVSLILSDRKAHCDTLQDILSDVHGIHTEVLTGSTKQKDRERIIQALHDGECRYLIATGQLIGEGFDLPGISTVFLSTPVKFSGRLIQYIGRALRPAPGKDKAIIFDFVDDHGVFEASAKSRHYTYGSQGIACCNFF